MAYILCLDKKDWPAFTAEVKVALGENDRPIWLGHFDEKGAWVPVCTVQGADGSCWTADARLSEEQVAELRAWVPDKVQVLEALPEGWQPAVTEEVP